MMPMVTAMNSASSSAKPVARKADRRLAPTSSAGTDRSTSAPEGGMVAARRGSGTVAAMIRYDSATMGPNTSPMRVQPAGVLDASSDPGEADSTSSGGRATATNEANVPNAMR